MATIKDIHGNIQTTSSNDVHSASLGMSLEQAIKNRQLPISMETEEQIKSLHAAIQKILDEDGRIEDLSVEYTTDETGVPSVSANFTNGKLSFTFKNLDGADGKSAYDIAVDEGFAGTKEEWLASLKGEPGAKGDTGAAGQSAPLVQSVSSTDTTHAVSGKAVVEYVSNHAPSLTWYEQYSDRMAQIKSQYRAGWKSLGPFSKVFLHFSDIHGDSARYERIKAFRNAYSQYIDDAICTGDVVKTTWLDDFSYWNDNSILNCIGNHDTRRNSSASWYSVTPKESYDRYFKPFISNWGVTQPDDADADGKCYYYKDYPAAGISGKTKDYHDPTKPICSGLRLIVIDVMHHTVDGYGEDDWLRDTLDDAKSKNYAVVIALHSIPAPSTNRDDTPWDEMFADLTTWEATSYYNITFMSATAMNYVESFIDGGGTFVCWICGHIHLSVLRNLTSYPRQWVVGVPAAAIPDWAGSSNAERVVGNNSEDCFNVYGIDLYLGVIKIARIGCNYDRRLRHLGTCLFDYVDRRILAQY